MTEIKIIRKEVQKLPVLYIQSRVPHTKLQPLFAGCFPKLLSFAMQKGYSIIGQPIARYIATGSGLWTVDCAIPLAESAKGNDEIQAGFLKAGPVAFATHMGAYDNLPETNAAIELWIESNGHSVDGSPWESYVTSPVEFPDPADWKTEVFWPLAE